MSSILETKLEVLQLSEERIKVKKRVLQDEIDAGKNKEKRRCGITTLEERVNRDKKYITSFNPKRLKYRGVREERIRILSNNAYMEIVLDIFHHQEERIKVLEKKIK